MEKAGQIPPIGKLSLQAAILASSHQASRRRHCPRCATGLSSFNFGYDSDVFLDRCGSCGGIWADRGEAIKVAQHLRGHPTVNRVAEALAQELGREQTRALDLQVWQHLGSPAGPWLFLPKIILPLGDVNPVSIVPYATIALIAANVAVSIYVLLGLFFDYPGLMVVLRSWPMVPAKIVQGDALHTLVSSMFLHGGILPLHLFGNMFFLWIFGDNVEESMGRWRYLLTYFLTGILGGLLYVALHPVSTTPVVGSSGGVSGVMGAYLAFHPQARMQVFFISRVISLSILWYLSAWFGFQLLMAFVGGEEVRVAWSAHVGAFLGGLLVGWASRQETRLSMVPVR